MIKRSFPKKLSICLVSQNFPVLERASDHSFLWPIATGLASLGHHVTVIAGKGNRTEERVERNGVTVYYLMGKSHSVSKELFSRLTFDKFKALNQEHPFDIVHGLDASALKIAEVKKEFRVAVAYDVNATQMTQVIAILGMGQETVSGIFATAIAIVYKFLSTYYGSDRKLLKTANGVFVTNPQQRLMLERYYLYPDYHIHTVPYGLEIGNLEPRSPAVGLRSTLNIPISAHVTLTTSDMIDVDEIKPLIQAFEKVAIKKMNAYLLIVGNGPKWKEIEFEILNLALGRRVLLLGAISDHDIPDYISICDVFINLTARTTGFESTIVESMAQEKVVIGSEVSPVANIIQDSVDGFLVRPADIDSISELLISIFSGNLPIQQMGEKARNKVMNFFDSKKMVQATIDAYYKIIQHSGFFESRDSH